MVKYSARRPLLLVLAALLGAVGIGPKRERGSGEPAQESVRSSPSPAPAPSAAPFGRVGIAPRVMAPIERRPDAAAPSPGFSPSAAGRSRFAPSSTGGVRIQRREGVENVPRRHYWHQSGGRRYSHFFDGRVHWYGYPFGAGFFWTRPYGGYWWTWDARFSHWSYWHDGFWWWRGPGGIQYVYINDDYYPYDAVRRSVHAVPSPAAADSSGAWTSPDGRRLVEVAGPDNDAILYDQTTATPSYLRYLGKDARKVLFSAAAPGSPPTILVEFRSGTFALFDYDGRRLDTAKPAPVKDVPPPIAAPPPPPPEGEVPSTLPPDDLPPPPG